MTEPENILISLDHRHAQNIYAGTKRVELRRRELHVNAGDVVWIYEKVPLGSITGSAKITAVHVASPTKLWREFGAVSGLSKAEFVEYFVGLEIACALELGTACRLLKPMTLAKLRAAISNFQPPQFFLRLGAKQPILTSLLTTGPKLNGVIDTSERIPRMVQGDRWEHLVALDEELLKSGVILSEWCSFIVREADIAFANGAYLASIITAVSGIETYLRSEYLELIRK